MIALNSHTITGVSSSDRETGLYLNRLGLSWQTGHTSIGKKLDVCAWQTSSSLEDSVCASDISRTPNAYCTVRVRFVILWIMVVVSVAVTTTV